MAFPETNWAILAEATLNGDKDGREALDQLCRDYWPAVAACLSVRGVDRDRVDDLTQDFFLHLMKKGFFKQADPEKGRFRSFMLTSLRYFLADDVRGQATQKKGGHLHREELTEESAVTEVNAAYFDRAWAERIFDMVYEGLKEETLANRGEAVWEVLCHFLPGASDQPSYEELAVSMGITEGGAKAEVFRLRQRFKDHLRAEVSRTVEAPHEVDEELAYLKSALQSS